MTIHPAGSIVPVTITYLEMLARPETPRLPVPPGPPTALVAARKPPVWYFLCLYRAVGGPWEWTDKLNEDPQVLQDFVQHPDITLFTLLRAGWPAGFFQLDARKAGEVELAYFGLVPEAIGQGLGWYLLNTAIHSAWDISGTKRLTVETCTLDHPRALGHYQKAGFRPTGQARTTRILSAPREMPDMPKGGH